MAVAGAGVKPSSWAKQEGRGYVADTSVLFGIPLR